MVGAKKLRTFHEGGSEGARPPMRLSYYGGGHYDSVVGRDHASHLLRSAPGTLENGRIGAAAQRGAGALEETKRHSDVAAAEGAELSAALTSSRQDFDRMQDFEWVFSEQTAEAMAAADAEEASRSLLAADPELAHALALSGGAPGGPEDQAGREDPELAHALSLSVGASRADPELQHALRLSKAGKGGRL